ncbi:hypothetical protein ACFSBZ_00435 [Amnibacterium flavum]|uniref:Uncharacterized protein n=1 Tax=Amnibacterium flavum TaxID=2173173 RepID=A0A2V1HMC1_9MICO|nr:hypothetical protein [Amnibacterium flavum]PVZ93605.1 hypothetical protein DDQ50_14955 [Amnibacterium flavum]
MPRLTEVKYDQTSPFHPFARQVGDGEWIVQPPESKSPAGLIRVRLAADGGLDFAVYPWHDDAPDSTPFEGSHPTLFHAVSWLRWYLQNPHDHAA